LNKDEAGDPVITTAGTKRKADVDVDEAEIRSRSEGGTLEKLKNDQLKEFLKAKGLPVSGKKADLVQRIEEYLQGS